jgi:hypothetical protein
MGRKKINRNRAVRDVFPPAAVTAEELRRIAGEIARILAEPPEKPEART